MKIAACAALLALLQFPNCSGEDYLEKSLTAVQAMPSAEDQAVVARRLVVAATTLENTAQAEGAAKQGATSCRAITNEESEACMVLYAYLLKSKRFEDAKALEDHIVKSTSDIWDFYTRWFRVHAFFEMDSRFQLNAIEMKRRLVTIAVDSLKEDSSSYLDVNRGIAVAALMSAADQKTDARRLLNGLRDKTEQSGLAALRDDDLEALDVGQAAIGDYAGAREQALKAGGVKTSELLARMAAAVALVDKVAAKRFADEALSYAAKDPRQRFETINAIMNALIDIDDKPGALAAAKLLLNAQGQPIMAFRAMENLGKIGAFDVATALIGNYQSPPPDAGYYLGRLAGEATKAGNMEMEKLAVAKALDAASRAPADDTYMVYSTYRNLVGAHLFTEIKAYAETQKEEKDRVRLLQAVAMEQAKSGDEAGAQATLRTYAATAQQIAYVQTNYIYYLVLNGKRDMAIDRAEKTNPDGKAMAYLLIGLADAKLPLDEK